MPTRNEKIENTIADINDAVGAALISNFPEALTGDVSPTAQAVLDAASKALVNDWVDANVPVKEKKTVEILLHDIEYEYDVASHVMSDGDMEHIAYSISQGFREGQLTADTCCGVMYGWWNIKK